MDELPDEMAQVWFLVRRVAGQFDRRGEAFFRGHLGISLAQFLVLSVVDAHPGNLSQQAIADRLGLTKGTVSRQLDNAIEAGLMTVEVSKATRRENVVKLTRAGTKLVRQGDALFEQARAESLPKLDARDVAVTLRTLAALDAALSQPG